jgi:hypothetical protein
MSVPRIRTKKILLVLIMLALASAGSSQATTCAPAAAACTPEQINAIPVQRFANPHWSINLTPGGYSDIVIYDQTPYPRRDPRDPQGPSPLHEMFSGEWAGALRYNKMTEWFPTCFRYPEWASGTSLMIVTPFTILGDMDGDGMDEAFSEIGNGNFNIRIEYKWEDTVTGVAMNSSQISPDPFVLSDRYILRQRYQIQNISGMDISDVSFFQFAAPHPANTETPTVDVGYDDMLNLAGALTDYRYDFTAMATNSGITDGFPTGSMFGDAVSFQSNRAPVAHDVDSYKGHNPGDPGLPDPTMTTAMKPLFGTHCHVENDTLNNATSLTQEEGAGAMKWDLGTIQAGAIEEVEVILTVRSAEYGRAAPACLNITPGADPEIHLGRGLCKTPSGPTGTDGPGQTYDIIRGSLAELITAPGCAKTFDCVGVIYPECMAVGHAMDTFDLPDDAHDLDPLYYLVRNSAPFTSWGMGQGPPAAPPLLRFYFGSPDASGVDICPVP